MPREPKKLSASQVNWIRRQGASGMSQSEVARRFTAKYETPISRHLIAKLVPPQSTAPAGLVRITLSLYPDHAEFVRQTAKRLGYETSRGPDAGNGNLSLMLEAIAVGELQIVRKR